MFRAVLSPGGRLIVGVDLKKDARRLVLAYNDAAGVTAAFNLNLLARINRELGGTFDLAAFRHEAIYNPREGPHRDAPREHARPGRRGCCGRRFRFRAGESIHTENSYKYSVRQFQDLARSAGWQPAARVDGRGEPVQRARAGFGLTCRSGVGASLMRPPSGRDGVTAAHDSSQCHPN